MPYARPLAPPPSLSDSPPRRQILFRHPSYDDSNNVLFKLGLELQVFTPNSHSTPAQYSQGVVSMASFRHHATPTKRATKRATPESMPVAHWSHAAITITSTVTMISMDLTDRIDGPDGPYRIVPNFRELRFPHEDIPAH
ncbi:hypothetical protein TUN199_11184 [Pyrenophora tritici-repentis]|nr:hypothetical protein Alg130_11349 [Pyrenophora tritici-repentis]KAI0616825.1 hypothetical protein TUN199_11184 [Pyrenophora tritici-repentis]